MHSDMHFQEFYSKFQQRLRSGRWEGWGIGREGKGERQTRSDSIPSEHRHAIKDVYGVDSTLEEPVIVTEHIFVISPDTKHDHHSVHQVRKLVAEYLEDIKYDVEVMDEWTDGCSAQYKSRHCMGDVSFSNSDFGYRTIRNYFETSHAKGPQDGAGANLRHKADIAVIKGQEVIQKAEDLYNFAQNNLKTPSPSRYQSENE